MDIRKDKSAKPVDFYRKKDVFGQEIETEDVKSEDENYKKDKINHSLEYTLPSIKTRYISMLIDALVIVLLSLGISSLFEMIGEVPDALRVIVFAIIIILYEPILISFACTTGQAIMNIRVRKFKNPKKKILFTHAILRLFTKALLGWISLLTVTFNDNHRAIHDFLSGSIVIVRDNNY